MTKSIILQTGSLAIRPSTLPKPSQILEHQEKEPNEPFKVNDWVIISSYEKEIFGEFFESKEILESRLILLFRKSKNFYDNTFFSSKNYQQHQIENFQLSQPIAGLSIIDTLEKSEILFLSPFIIKSLNLSINDDFHNGIYAFNDNKESVIKMITWNEDYLGSLSDGTEIPRIKGTAVLVRQDYFKRLMSLNNNIGKFLFFKIERPNDST